MELVGIIIIVQMMVCFQVALHYSVWNVAFPLVDITLSLPDVLCKRTSIMLLYIVMQHLRNGLK